MAQLSILDKTLPKKACSEQKSGYHLAPERYVFGTRLYQQPDIPKPGHGEPFYDPVFGTRLTRISDRKVNKLVPWISGSSNGSLMHPSYPRHNYDNADGSLLLFQGSYGSGQLIYDAKTLDLVKSLDTRAVNWGASIDPRWDAHDPDVLYYYFSPPTALSRYNVRHDKFGIVHDFEKEFPGSTTITVGEEGDCSYDSRYFAFAILAPRHGNKWSSVAVLCYDRAKDRIVGQKELPIRGFESQGGGNWVGMSPSGKYVLLGTAPVLVFDREFKAPPVKLTHGGGWHCDVGLDDEGREVIFYPGGRAFSPKAQSDGCYAMCDLESGTETVLTEKIIGPQMHLDASCIFTPGWGLISTYHSAPLRQTHWSEYCIFLLELTRRRVPPPRIWRICHTHVNRGGYVDDPFATFDRFGKKIFFGSNWGVPIEKGGDIDVYQVELPEDWYEHLMGKDKATKLRAIAVGMTRKTW